MSQPSEPEGHGSDDESSSDDDTPRHSSKPSKRGGPKFFELKDGREIGFGSARSNRTMSDKNDVKDKYSLAARMKRESGSSGGGGSGDRVVKASGNRSITFKARGEDGGFDKPLSGGSRGDRGRGRGRGRGGQARGRGRGRGRGSR
ncbi:hypothetical protein HK098_000531 [Nowakowskiella sp. JEL0407]|nr:hypothetical protein HK098_000531 [Nowakowskiella sp. JEL0407]